MLRHELPGEAVRQGEAKGPGGGHFAVNGRCTPLVFHTLMKESFEAEIRLPAHRRRSGGGRAEVRPLAREVRPCAAASVL